MINQGLTPLEIARINMDHAMLTYEYAIENQEPDEYLNTLQQHYKDVEQKFFNLLDESES